MKRTLAALGMRLYSLFRTGIPIGIELDVLNDEAISLYKQGHYDRAVVVANKALRIAERVIGGNDPALD
jgi:hypothetical protein